MSGRRRRKPGSRRARRALARTALVLAAGAVAAGSWQAWTWPDVRALAERPPASTAFIERARESGDAVSWAVVPYDRISPHLKRAVVVAEDINFFGHSGFDTQEIKIAIGEAARSGEAPRGASTISQQLVKNLWLSPSRSPLRKAKEAVLTWQIERALGKRRILELYLNVAEFGPSIFGAEAAARHYFGEPAALLDEREAAQLAAGLSRPSRWNPSSESEAYARHVERILGRMERAAWLEKAL